MYNIGRFVIPVFLCVIMSSCAVQPIEYQSNQFLEGPGLFDGFNSPSEGSESDAETSSSGTDNKCLAPHMNFERNINNNSLLLREFEIYLQTHNLQKESQQHEMFLKWLVWRSQTQIFCP